MVENEEWRPLNGCNACINGKVCEQHGNCILLTLDHYMPENNKKKKRMISRIRTFGSGDVNQLKCYEKKIGVGKERKEIEIVNVPTVRLTKIEQLFIECLNRKR